MGSVKDYEVHSSEQEYSGASSFTTGKKMDWIEIPPVGLPMINRD